MRKDAGWPVHGKTVTAKLKQFISDKPVLAASIILAVLALIFIGKSIILPGYFGPGDAIRVTQPFLAEKWPHTTIFGDVVFQFLPWLKLSREILLSGHFPLWNPYSGLGLPLFANMQSAILFPLSWLYFALGFKFGLLATSFIKLFLLGLFTFLFLREKKFDFYVAIAGAIGFMFAGSNVLWLLWPLTAVVILLPAGLWLIEKYFVTGRLKWLLWFSPTLMLAVLAGHPETLFIICFTLGLYFLFTSFIYRGNWLQRIYDWIGFGLLSLLGVAMAAVVLVPFLEYLLRSAAYAHRQIGNLNFLPKFYAITNFIPDFFGNLSSTGFSYVVYPNYNEISMGYVGITLALLALIGLIYGLRNIRDKANRVIAFFGALAAFCLCMIYRVEPVYDIITKLPGFRTNFSSRFLLIWASCLVVMGCYGLAALLKREIGRRQIWTAAAIMLVAVSALFAYAVWRSHGLDITGHSWRLVTAWQWTFFGIFIINLIAGTIILINLDRKWAKALLLILIFGETAIHSIAYNHVTKPQDFYPTTDITNYLQQHFSDGYYRTFPHGHIILPSLSTWYGFDQFNDYDALYVQEGKDLKAYIGPVNGTPEYLKDIYPDYNALKFLSVKYLVFTTPAGEYVMQSNPGRFKKVLYNGTNMILEQEAFPRVFGVRASSLDDLSKKLKALIHSGDLSGITFVSDYRLENTGASSFNYNFYDDTYLIMDEVYYPDWYASIDGGQPTEFTNAFHLKVLKVPGNKHSVTVTYRPRSFRLGWELSLGAIIVWIIGFLFLCKRQIGTKLKS